MLAADAISDPVHGVSYFGEEVLSNAITPTFPNLMLDSNQVVSGCVSIARGVIIFRLQYKGKEAGTKIIIAFCSCTDVIPLSVSAPPSRGVSRLE